MGMTLINHNYSRTSRSMDKIEKQRQIRGRHVIVTPTCSDIRHSPEGTMSGSHQRSFTWQRSGQNMLSTELWKEKMKNNQKVMHPQCIIQQVCFQSFFEAFDVKHREMLIYDVNVHCDLIHIFYWCMLKQMFTSCIPLMYNEKCVIIGLLSNTGLLSHTIHNKYI